LAEIRIQDGETLESALRRFKRKVLQEDIIKETKRHSFYLKPGEKKRIKSALARKRNRKKRSRDGGGPGAGPGAGGPGGGTGGGSGERSEQSR
jgi:small subunit ribosomal protein S21